MPYQNNGSLPASVRDKYSAKCQSVFREVFNSTHAKQGEERAFQNAHAAARRCQERKTMPEAIKFSITSGLLKAYTGDDGKKRLKTVASSTIRDRAGDQITEKAIRKMADTAKQNMTLYLNHSYKVPEDVFGSVEDATVTQREAGVWDLDFDVRLEDSNERAVKTYEAILNGTKLGTSIGAGVIEGGVTRDKDSGGWVFDDIELYEASIVALPANPRSWVQHAVKSLIEAKPDDEEESVQKTVWVETAGGDKVTVGEPVEAQEQSKGKKKDAEPEIEKAQEDEEEEEEEAPAAEEAETEEAKKQLEVSVTKSTEEAPPSAQEGQETTPESADIEEDLDAVKVSDFAQLVDLLRSTTGELVEARGALAKEKEDRRRAEEDGQKLRAELVEARDIVEAINNLPQGRRAVVQYHVTDFRQKFGHIYGEDFAKMMETKDNA